MKQTQQNTIRYLFLLLSPNFINAATNNLPNFEAIPLKAQHPAENPGTQDKVELGKMLFFDPRLSSKGTVSCNSCHAVENSGTDNLQFSTGIEGKLGGRNSPTVFNSAFNSVQFWDGRANTLEDQAKGPMINPVEMGNPDHKIVVDRLNKIPGYVEYFKKVFPKEKEINIDNVAKAIAAFERTLITPSPVDDFIRGKKTALSSQAIRGMQLVEKVGCTTCHMGVNYNGPTELPKGVGFYQKFPTYTDNEFVKKYDLMTDKGRFQETKDVEDMHKYRVPTWRNVAITAPYFHNGSVKTLEEAVKVMAKTQLNVDLKENEITDIVAFLESLTGRKPKISLPELPRTSKYSAI
jgi:cytochrome c peroxidase